MLLFFFFITPEQVWANCDDPNNNVLLAFKQLEENYEEKLKYVIWKKKKTNQLKLQYLTLLPHRSAVFKLESY